MSSFSSSFGDEVFLLEKHVSVDAAPFLRQMSVCFLSDDVPIACGYETLILCVTFQKQQSH